MPSVSHGKPPDVSNLRVFGSPCFSYVEKQHRLSSNYHAHAERGIFLGYDTCSPSYYVYIPARKCILTRHEVKCDEGFDTGLDVLLGKYVKGVDEVVEFQAITSVPTQPRSASSSDLDKLFKPSVSLGPSKRLNSQNDRKLLNHCTSKAPYIRNRCQAIHGKSFNDARLMVFPTSDKKNCARRYYSKTDMLYDIKHVHLQFDWTPITVGQKKEVAENNAELVEEAHALSQMSPGAEPLNRREAKCRPDWPQWLCAEQREWKELKQCNTYRWVSTDELKQKGLTIISSKFA